MNSTYIFSTSSGLGTFVDLAGFICRTSVLGLRVVETILQQGDILDRDRLRGCADELEESGDELTVERHDALVRVSDLEDVTSVQLFAGEEFPSRLKRSVW